MSFLYFAYGSNTWLPQIRSRCPSAAVAGVASLDGWRRVYDKRSQDGSSKLNIRPEPGSSVPGVLYEIEDEQRPALDAAESGYLAIEVDVGGETALTYRYDGPAFDALPYQWYAAMVDLGAADHGFDPPTARSTPDPLAPGLRPARESDIAQLTRTLSDALEADDGRYTVHPGDLLWWRYHEDPRAPLTYWIDDDAVLVINDHEPEINLFASPEVDRVPLIEWAQRRLRRRGEVGWVADTDVGLVAYLEDNHYSPVSVDHMFEWDLERVPVPEPDLPDGWTLRHVVGEEEANGRRTASHAAFESTMSDEGHLERYLRFMRSPAYEPKRDLVAVAPEGRIASFMIWWSDDTGVAQIEPFGTHPDFQRRGIGRALIHHGLQQMRDEGIHTVRVLTNEPREAIDFYPSVGFADVGRVRWWGPPG